MKTLFGHPRGIYILFLTEMWERFSFYGMRALLIFYLTKHWAMPDTQAAATYGAYGSLVYGVSIFGGWVADKWFGLRRNMLVGGTMILAGHVTLAIEGWSGSTEPGVKALFFLALALIVTGTGFFKPAVSSQVGALYPANDHRRETGFYIFYCGINIGSALAALVCGYIGQTYGWSWGFGAAALGMALGLTILVAGRDDLPESFQGKRAPLPIMLGVAVVAVAPVWLMLTNPGVVGWVLAASLALGVAAVGHFMVTPRHAGRTA
jgi:POT family proton-dependent oligopeptide transporter